MQTPEMEFETVYAGVNFIMYERTEWLHGRGVLSYNKVTCKKNLIPIEILGIK